MGKVTFIPELNSKPRKDGLFGIMIRITKNRQIKRINTGLFVKKSDWNVDKREIRKSNKDYQLINNFIQKKINEISIENINADVNNKQLTISTLQRKMKNEAGGGDFIKFATDFTQKKQNSGTQRVYRTVLKKLQEFKFEIDFTDITRSFLSAYEKYLREEKGNMQNTIHKNLTTIRTFYYEAIKQEVFEPTANPFLHLKIKKSKSVRSRLNFEEIEQLESLQLDENLKMFHAKNLFLMQYYTLGTRVGDMLTMKWSNIIDNRFEYTSGKTGKLHRPKLCDKALAILQYYQQTKPQKKSDYIFPFLQKKHWENHEEYRRDIESKTSQVNNNLKKVAAILNLKKNISSHVSRHSFAENARLKTNDIYAISKALGHSSISITEAYFGTNYEESTDKITDFLFGKD